jgi:hypothetical protein
MKIRLAVLACTILATAPMSQAQILGLPVADHAGRIPAGTFQGAGSFSHSSDFDLYGARGGYSITDAVRCFGDLGFADNDVVGQAGSIVAFQTELPIDLGLRGAVYKGFSDDVDILGFNAMAMTSMQVYYVGLFVYGGLGVDLRLQDDKAVFPETNSDDKTSVNPSAVLGCLFPATDELSFFLEGAYVDPFFVSAGARFLY